MIKQIVTISSIAFLLACSPNGVKKNNLEQQENEIVNRISKKEQLKELQKLSLKPIKPIANKKLANNIKLTYFIHGDGEKFKQGEVAVINYEVLLKNGTLVDGNKLLNRESLPFLVGYGMQTPGWDIAFNELRVGDFVEIYLPGNMARGKHGIKGLIPPNAENIIHIKIVDKLKPTREIDGTKVWLLEQNPNNKDLITENNEVEFHYMVGTASNPRYDISYRRNQPYVLKFSDYGIVKGLKKALINAKKSDKLWILIPPKEAYGSKGLQDLVKPNEPIFYDIFIQNVR